TTADRIFCKAGVAKGPCRGQHRGKIFDLDPDLDGDLRRQKPDAFEFEVRSPSLLEILKEDPWSFLWPAHPPTRTYELAVNTCGNVHHVTVVAYPDIKWTAGFTI